MKQFPLPPDKQVNIRLIGGPRDGEHRSDEPAAGGVNLAQGLWSLTSGGEIGRAFTGMSVADTLRRAEEEVKGQRCRYEVVDRDETSDTEVIVTCEYRRKQLDLVMETVTSR